MKLDVKLDHFSNSVIENATNQSQSIIDEYKQSLQKIYDDKKEELLRKASLSLKVETDSLIRQKNKTLSSEATGIRRQISDKTNELKDSLFLDVEQQLNEFMKTEAYTDLLIKQIHNAIQFARGEKMTVYINPSDAEKKACLEAKTGIELTVSATDFKGGTRAVIHEKSILIDNSFLTKLAEEKDTFRF